MNYAILSADTITAHGPASTLWPDTSFAAGPNASFLIEANAVTIRSDAAYDPATEFLQPCEPYVLDGEVFDTIAAPIISPAPTPDWMEFGVDLAVNPGIAALYAAIPGPLASGLSIGLSEAGKGSHRLFAGLWGRLMASGAIEPELLSEIAVLAAQHNLPAEFIAGLTGASQTE